MKILIQDVKRGLYMANDGSWTASVLNAKDFRYSAYAHSVTRKEKVRGLRVFFYFEELDYAIKLKRWSSERFCQQLSTDAFDF